MPGLRVLHVITTTAVGGAETQLLRLVEGSRGLPLAQHVVGLGPPGPLAGPLEAAGARVSSLGLSPGPAALIRGLPRLAGLIRRVKPDLVQTWMYHADLMGLLAARLAGRPPVVWSLRCSDLDLHGQSRATRLVIRLCARLSRLPQGIIANSAAGRDWHAGLGYPASAIRVIPNGFDTARYRPDAEARRAVREELGVGPEEVLVGHVASYQPVKDHAGFLAACALAAAEEPRLRFLLVGRGVTPENPALARAFAPPLAGRARLLGQRDDVPRLLAGLDILAASSLSEGFPNAIGEAMAAGLTVAATRVGDSEPLVQGCGRLVDPGDAPALAAALVELARLTPDRRAALGLKARARIEGRYSQARLAAAHLALYQELAGAAQA